MEMENFVDRNRNDEEVSDEKPDYTEDWRRFFLLIDRLCFVVLVAILTIIFFSMLSG